jgi:outer membrane protein TolC
MALPNAVKGQQYAEYSLQDIVTRAQSLSYSSKLNDTHKEIGYYQYISYKSTFKPQITFYGNAPVYNKEYYAVRQPDGTISFQAIKQHNSNIGLALSQQLPFSGGTLSLNTNLSRFDDLELKTTQYSGTPVYLELNQPLFAVNELKWSKKIEPLKYRESQKQHVYELENIAQKTTELYFNVLDAQNSIEIAKGNLAATAINYEIEKKRVILGTTTEDKVLQLELQALKTKQDLEQAKYDLTITQLNLKTFIGIKQDTDLALKEPDAIPKMVIRLADAFDYARKNRPEFVAFQRKLQEAERDAALAKAANKEVNIIASYGLNNIGTEIGSVYHHPNSQQRFNIGINLPIIDWGRRKARYNTAKALEKLTEITNEFDEESIYQDITTLIKNIELLESNITLAQKTDSVAKRRYSIANSLYQSGRLSITELSIAQSEKDNSRRSYINALRAYWNSYYQLRRQTLYDFSSNQSMILP